MKELKNLFDRLWEDYSAMNRQAGVIRRALEARGEHVVNDHVAFRTFDAPGCGIEVLAGPFEKLGYRAAEDYRFKEKKLKARYYAPPEAGLPKVFISALELRELTPAAQDFLGELLSQMPKFSGTDNLISGPLWKPVSWPQYQALLRESEYAAWMAALGFRVNHFTVFFNALKTFSDLAALNAFIKGLGFPLNERGGEIKGSSAVFLEQSSTMAQPVETLFSDRTAVIPACYYEFARRYPGKDGNLFEGFIPDSADKIFESTDFRASKPSS